MEIVKCLILALILPASINQAEIVFPTSSPDKTTSGLVEAMVQIVTTCYGDQIKAVGLAGNLPDTLLTTLSVKNLIPVTLMGDTGHMPTKMMLVSNDVRYKLRVFIVGASSDHQLFDIIQGLIMNSIWWNHMASFFILDQSPTCNQVMRFLLIPWRLELLYAKVICYHSKYGGYMFTYNPFSSQAPVEWQQLHGYISITKQAFTLFRRKYQGNESICVNLDFVRTKDLGGYEIRVHGPAKTLAYRDKKWPELSQTMGVKARTLHLVFRALNVTPKFTDLNFRGSDMSMQYAKETNHSTYPYKQFGFVIVTKYRGHKSQLEKILYVIDLDSRIGMGLVYLITFVFFKFFVHQALGPALLNLVRITCNTGFTNLPDNTATRMYLTGLLFFVVTLQGIYQGNLASLLTHKIPVRNVNTFKDIVDLDYKIYSSAAHKSFFGDYELRKRYIQINNFTECVERVLTESSAACVDIGHGYTLDAARRYDLHLSKEFVKQLLTGFYIRPSWFLAEQMNIILGRITEGDLYETWEAKCNPTKLDDYQYDKEVRNNADFKIIELVELNFAFAILGIGLLCATVTFIFEVAIYRYQQHVNNTVIILHSRYDRDGSARSSFGCADRTSENTHAPVTQPSPTNQSTNELAS